MRCERYIPIGVSIMVGFRARLYMRIYELISFHLCAFMVRSRVAALNKCTAFILNPYGPKL